MKKIIIAIDGFSSTGKSTLAKQIATYLGYIYVDTGAMYRAITLYALQNNLISAQHFDKEELIKKLPNINLTFAYNTTIGYSEIYLNGINIENKIRTIEVASFVSKIAEISEIRAKLVEQQQEMGKNKGIVMDGRDIGTVVFPNAELKLFMTASASTRAQRRYQEMYEKDKSITYNTILQNVQERDNIDTNRKDSPLKKAIDAIEIDNSNLTKEEQFNLVISIINKR